MVPFLIEGPTLGADCLVGMLAVSANGEMSFGIIRLQRKLKRRREKSLQNHRGLIFRNNGLMRDLLGHLKEESTLLTSQAGLLT